MPRDSIPLPRSLVYLASKACSIATYAFTMATCKSDRDLPKQHEVLLLGVGSWCGTPDDNGSSTLPPCDFNCYDPLATLENLPDQSDQHHYNQIQINGSIHAPPITATLGDASRGECWELPYSVCRGEMPIQDNPLRG